MNVIKYMLMTLLVNIFIAGKAQGIYQRTNGYKYLDTIANTTNQSADLPVIIGFHYSSSTPHKTGMEYDQIKHPVRLILPQGNFRKRDGFSYFPPDYYSKDSLTQMRISKITVDSMANFVRAIGKKYKRKPIVAGFSQGGDISFLLAIYYPELITAAFPLAGFVHTQRLDDVKRHAQKTVPISIYQGEDDTIISVMYSKKEVETLNSYFLISLKTYPTLGHDFSMQMKKDYASRMSDFFEK